MKLSLRLTDLLRRPLTPVCKNEKNYQPFPDRIRDRVPAITLDRVPAITLGHFILGFPWVAAITLGHFILEVVGLVVSV